MEITLLITIINIVACFFALIPLLILLRTYYIIRIPDYLIFALFFVFSIIILITEALFKQIQSDEVVIAHHIAIDTAFFLLLLHAIWFQWVKNNKPIFVVGITYYIILLLTGYITNYSSEYRLLGDFFRIYTLSFLLLIYLRIEKNMLKQSIQGRKAKKFWLIAWSLLLLHSINLLNTEFFPYTELNRILYFSFAILVIYISLFLEEGLLLSKSQILRGYKIINNKELPKSNDKYLSLDLNKMKNYLSEMVVLFEKN